MKLWPNLTSKNIIGFLEGIIKVRRDDVNEISDIQTHTVTSRTLISRWSYSYATAGEQTLYDYVIPPGTLINNGHYLEYEASFSFAANGNNKRVRLYFGSTVIYDSTSLAKNGGALVIKAVIIRTSLTTQQIYVTAISSGTIATTAIYTVATENLSNPLTLKTTGDATANSDIIQQTLTFKFYPAN